MHASHIPPSGPTLIIGGFSPTLPPSLVGWAAGSGTPTLSPQGRALGEGFEASVKGGCSSTGSARCVLTVPPHQVNWEGTVPVPPPATCGHKHQEEPPTGTKEESPAPGRVSAASPLPHPQEQRRGRLEGPGAVPCVLSGGGRGTFRPRPCGPLQPVCRSPGFRLLDGKVKSL
jgi:hypothetical protein